ncbi:GAF domain-containing protein [Pseudoxanthomonas sp. GM95]|uniref:GAF domain-containing protein n=1 Tax=Pseudoxanthomonas sp. GM95 TaxID=1881043 RepID=UPI0008D85B6B|nr:GAF domain-containing protein [Pseudoxanthomonas sp. GM95]SEL00626.1 GAF domain-containing protein [Pseudoxanthomonas sp. GM95]
MSEQEQGQSGAQDRAREVEQVALLVPGLNDVLEQVLHMTGMRFAAVARVTESRWTALAVLDRWQFGLKPGDDLVIEKTICNEVRKHRQVVAFSHASADPRFASHPLPALYGFESHVSVPIYLESGEMFGTLCALDPEPRMVTDALVGEIVELAGLIGGTLSQDLAAVDVDGRSAA